MHVHEARRIMCECIHAVAPEVDLDLLDGDASLRDEIDLDSIDFLAIVAAIRERTGYELPERAYPAFDTLAGAVDHLATHVTDPPSGRSPGPSR